jgi:hypothetical protein
MKISRCGSGAYHGTVERELGKLNYGWDQQENALTICAHLVSDFNTNATHDYTIDVPLHDLARILQTLGESAVASSPDVIEDGMKPALRALIRLTSLAAGITSSLRFST